MTPRPPRLSRLLLAAAPFVRRRPEVADELQDLFEMRAAREGRRAAVRRYRADVLSVWLNAMLWTARPHSPEPSPSALLPHTASPLRAANSRGSARFALLLLTSHR